MSRPPLAGSVSHDRAAHPSPPEERLLLAASDVQPGDYLLTVGLVRHVRVAGGLVALHGERMCIVDEETQVWVSRCRS